MNLARIELDDAQKAVVTATSGPIAVIAGPGSGKTRVIVERIAHLIETIGVPASRILAITFTVKAAHELRTRLSVRLGGADTLPEATTFHSLCFEILQKYGATVAPANWRIASPREQRETLLRALGKRPSKRLIDAVSALKANLSTRDVGSEKLRQTVDSYNTILRAQGLLDFDDLLALTYALLKEVRPPVVTQYEHIIVDEHQDSSALQCALLELLAGGGNLCLVGDPDQAIYTFRGATPEALLRFAERDGATTHRLGKNYRSTESIVRAATGLIATDGRERRLHAQVSGGEPVRIVAAPTARGERAWILRTIESLLGGTDYSTLEARRDEYAPTDIAVLYRTNTIGDFIEEGFRASGLPYERRGGSSFFEHPEIQRIIGALTNLDATKRDRPVSDQLRACLATVETLSDRALELLTLSANYDDLLPEEGRDRLITLAALAGEGGRATKNGQAITLLTAHAAKGLEFRAVFIAGAEEGLFPHVSARHASDDALAEERRLFYVAMTRAKERLYISWSRERLRFGAVREQQPSRFLTDIPDDCCIREEIRLPQHKKIQAKLF